MTDTPNDQPVLRFAASELRRYFRLLTGERLAVRIRPDDVAPRLTLGEADGATPVDVPAVLDPRLDDAIDIRVRGREGHIAGSNARSVLLATYRYLEALGCRWIRPGADGEVVPRILVPDDEVRLREVPSYRHRTICIEGAVARHHLTDMIDYASKLGFNGYFLQFRDGDGGLYTERWNATGHPKERGRLTLYEVGRREIAKRGVMLHAGGHGWTSGALELPEFQSTSSGTSSTHVSRGIIAKVSGRRIVFQGVPSNTNLCYSNPAVRRRYVREVVDYLRKRPDVDVLHLWLADDLNNHCECDACVSLRPADYYVALLNEVDRALTQSRIPTKITCLIYLDLMWAPLREQLQDSDRFILEFAPITRTYREPFREYPNPGDLLPYRRNSIRLPRSTDEHVHLLRAWQLAAPGTDSFAYEYHFYRNQYIDFGSLGTLRVLHADLRVFHSLGLNGYVACQSPRSAFPTGLGDVVLGKMLWDRSRTMDEITREYLTAAFGDDSEEVHSYLDLVGRCLDPAYFTGEGFDAAELRAGAERLITLDGRFEALAEKNARERRAPIGASWRFLRIAMDLHRRMAAIVISRLDGEIDSAIDGWQALRAEIGRMDGPVQRVLDTYLLARELEPILGSRREPPRLRLSA